MSLTNKEAYIYIKNNGLKHPVITTRAFGTYNAGRIYIHGRSLTRTWSLLSNQAIFGMTSISLLHKPEDMVSVEFVRICHSIECLGMESWRSNCDRSNCHRF
jgi:hypothetical protein